MRTLLVLLVSIGLVIGLCACGTTVQQSVKADEPAIGGSGQLMHGPSAGYHAYQHDEWIQDTPYGY